MNEQVYIDRPPRIQPELPVDEIEIPGPPKKEEDSRARLIQVGLPLLTIIGYVLVAALGGRGRNPLLMIPMALAVVASTGFAIYSYFKEKQRRAEIERAYSERLIQLNKEMHVYHDMQRRFYRYNYPDQSTTFRIVHNARVEVEKIERILRSESRLWERRVTDEDFGVVRLGMGTLPSTVIYVLGEVENPNDPQAREAMKLQADSRYVTDIPVIISLRQAPEDQKEEKDEEDSRIPVTHALGVAGESNSVYEFMRALLTHYVTFHPPMDARLFVLAPSRQEWAWIEHLPHSQADEQTEYLCFTEEGEVGKKEKTSFDEDEESVQEKFLEGIRKVLAQRKIRLQERDENEGQGDPTLPFILVVVDLLEAMSDEKSPLRKLESDAAISILLEQGAALGAAVIFLVPERGKVPSGCRSVIEIERTTPETNSRLERNQRLHFRYAETGVNTFRYVGQADSVTSPEDIIALAEKLTELQVRQGYGANLTSTVPFLGFMGYNSLQELEVDTWQKWRKSTEPDYANWLRVKLGLMSGNKPRTLVFSAKRDGVHGMVAGSTGSGKSELLISLITGMAVTYDPTVLNFVLVDYKGGGAFKELEKLPHCVDIITNLGSDGVTRMFTAIQSELRRRQALNAETGTKNIVEYRQKNLHKDRAYPYLFIIIDEFAEMIADRSEYRGQLESITRVGRAQGVSLILAAQRPSGVTDQMRSNIKFRICLRVETPGESREMLRRPDAAFLPGGVPGRGYLQVGNEEIELIQVAYTGDKYVDPNLTPQSEVIWPDRGDNYDASFDQEPPELYQAIVDVLARLARGKVKEQRAPWPDFLPAQLSLSEPLISADPNIDAITSEQYLVNVDKITLGRNQEALLTLNPAINNWLTLEKGWIEDLDWEQYAMRPVVGLVDNPYAAQQLPLVIDHLRGHMVIFGASGWGKTTFIRSLIVSLAATHSPDHLHVYVLDLGGRNLGVLQNLPHVGAVIIPDEEGYEERVEQLLREIDSIVETRKNLLSNAGTQDIYEFNNGHRANAQPAILVAIDNFVEFIETFGGQDEAVESVLDKLVALARQAKPYGIHFVISVNQLSDLSSQLYSLFTERLTLKLAESTEYRAIVGGAVPDIGDIPGRGYIKIGRDPLSFQVALPFDLRRDGLKDSASEVQELEQLARTMNDYIAQAEHKYKEPIRIDALPKTLLFKHILARAHNLAVDESFLDRLKEITKRKWAESIDPDHADWLSVTIGVISGNRLRQMNLEAKRDGVHGMIAGGTGSGKSELLMTLIVGLALNYDPGILNFVLVDYKGGGAFKPFENLPHCVDTITNLNKAAVERMFTAINAEMQRRQKLNAETATKDIVEYRAKGLHLTHAPYPHLFIIIDEYAEMITDNPDFRDELDSITRVGRAQGVNLLLASQRPTGVSDQMRANIKFRICLRVEGVDTSREMLRRSDAAFLPNGMPGRGYLQVGNENIELIQVAYTGETYPYAEVPEGGRAPKFYDVMVDLTNELLAGERPHTPWPPFLPKALTLSDPLLKDYLDQSYQPLITLGQTESLALNPFAQGWLEGKRGWHGMDWGETAMRAIAGLLDDPYNARQLPLIVNMTRGHAVIFGASGWGKTSFIRSLILSLASTHSPDEFHAHILDLGGRNLEVLGALPQVGTIIMPDERGYEERVQQLWRELNDLVDERKRLFSEAGVSTVYEYNSSHPDGIQPAVLVVIDNFAEYIESFGGSGQRDDKDNLLEMFVSLARQGKAYGLHFVISASRLNVLSSKLYSLFTERLTLRLSDSSDYSAIVGTNIGDIEEIPGRGFTKVGRQALGFQVALPPGSVTRQGQIGGEARQIRAIGAKMGEFMTTSGHRYGQPLRIGALPQSSSYRQVLSELLGIRQEKTFLDELTGAIQELWERNRSAQNADWLQVTLGIISGNRQRTLKLEAKKDGVHGMVAGGTGSGKSELLMTMIVGLAVNYPPDILNLVLVDYKGGGAFKPFERLPHCVDIVTNLNKAAVDRMFTAINAEIRRRQALNAETGTKDIIEYRRKGLHLSREPYPHLFIIIDEYAEMIDDNPEYRLELESITRVGRAQGVNLILASQRPKGVTDQMRANIKLRLCLRVEQADTSQELLRRPDAARLPSGIPGRGYIQAGDENLELIQVSYTGEKQPDEREAPVLWPDHFLPEITPADEEIPRLFDAVVTITSELFNGQRAPKPWPGFLPSNFSLQSSLYDAKKNKSFTLEEAVTDWLNDDTEGLWPGIDWDQGAMCPVVGLVDDPAEAQQYPLRFDLKRSHLAFFGDSGMGKTVLLRTLLTSLAATHSPDELHIYVLDLGGRNFRSLEELPHVGTVIYADEEAYEERQQRLLDKLDRMVEERQQVLSNADAANLYEYNKRHPEQVLPAVVVVIDNFAELQENYEALVDRTLLPLVRRSSSVGLSFVVSSHVPNNMPSKLYNLFGERLTFKQSNADRYLDIVGRGAIEIDDIPGRGYIRIGRHPLMMQAAQPVGIFDDSGRDSHPEADELRLMAAHMHKYLAGKTWSSKPDPIEILPDIVVLEEMLKATEMAHEQGVQAVLGLSGDLQPALFNLKRMGSHFAVFGPPLSGKTTALRNWVLSLALRYSPRQVKLVLIDLQRKLFEYGGRCKLAELPHVLATVSDVQELDDLITNLKNEGEWLGTQDSQHEIFIIIDNFDELNEEIELKRGNWSRELAGLARRYGPAGLHFIIAGMPEPTSGELRRRVQSASYGLGLRTAEALSLLNKFARTPPNLRDKELPVGRGYIVKSGEMTMIQVGIPYDGRDGGVGSNGADGNERIVQALDAWVGKIQAKHAGHKASWSKREVQTQATQTTSSAQSKKLGNILAVLQLGMRKEINRLNGDSVDELIITQLMRMDISSWNDEKALMTLVRELGKRELVERGIKNDVIDLYLKMDDDSFLMELYAALTRQNDGS